MTVTTTPTRPVPDGGEHQERHPSPRPWGTGRVVATVAAALSLLLGSALLLTGVGVAAMSTALRGHDGLYASSPATWSSTGAAVRTESLRLHGPMMPTMAHRMVGRLEVTADSGRGRAVFVGVARTGDVERFLGGVASTVVRDPWDSDERSTATTPGSASAGPPAGRGFWVASATGRGPQTVTWDADDGDWTLVVMNADGRGPVRAEVTARAELPIVSTLGVVLIVSGLVVLVAAGTGLWFATAGAPTHSPARPSTPSTEEQS